MYYNLNRLYNIVKTIGVSFLLTFLFLLSAQAKNSSNPSMRFYMKGEATNIFEAMGGLKKIVQLQYNYANDTTPVDSIYEEKTGVHFLKISDTEYLSSAPVFARYQKLLFVFENDTMMSEQFTYSGFNSAYEMKFFKENFRKVKDITPWFFRDALPFSFFRNLIVNLLVEVLVLWLVLLLFKYPHKTQFLLGILIANIVSIVVFTYGILNVMDSIVGFILGMLFVILFEASFLWYFTRKAGTFGKMLLLVVFLNFISMLVNGALQFFNAMFGADLLTRFI